MNKKRLAAVIAAVALGLSACGAETEPTMEPTVQETVAETQTAEPTVEPEDSPEPHGTTPPADDPEDSPPAGDFPFEEGPVDVDEFADRYVDAMEAVDHVTVTTFVEGQQTVVVAADLSDRNSPAMYVVMEAEGQTIESVSDGGQTWTRIGGEGPWQESGQSEVDAEELVYDRDVFSSVELLDSDQRQFRVVMSVAEGADLEMVMWLDDQFRTSRSQVEVADFETVNEYDYDTPVEIPDVG